MRIETRQIDVHGHRVSYRSYTPPRSTSDGGETDPLVLLHGIAGSGQTWLPVLEELARREFPRAVIAVDLLGHGGSAAPRGDYSVSALAGIVRDTVGLLGHQHATIVGHSLGGGVAMQFAYLFPERCGRLVLIASGGFGRSVSPLIRASNLPGAGTVIATVLNKGTTELLTRQSRRWQVEARELAAHLASLSDPAKRTAYLQVVRGSTDIKGQRVSATDRLYLAEAVPTLIIWGDRDRIIPVEHGLRAAKLMPNSRLEIIEGAGHFPHCSYPRRVVAELLRFLETTAPARLNSDDLVDLVRLGPPGRLPFPG
jgi:pimeloyl-ACP methyl ester carboxylesterase